MMFAESLAQRPGLLSDRWAQFVYQELLELLKDYRRGSPDMVVAEAKAGNAPFQRALPDGGLPNRVGIT